MTPESDGPDEDLMDRRAFMRTGIIASTMVMATTGMPKLATGDRAARARRSGAGHAEGTSSDFGLAETTIDRLQDGMRSGTYTARSIAEQYLARIDAMDQQGPAVNALIELNPDALQIADALDVERKTKGPRGPLHGIPIVIKDNIATHDRMQTTAGSLALVDSAPPRDAFIVECLRAAGAVILAKANLSEWANYRSTHSQSGWSGRGGQTRNPYALDRNPSGSSSGSGAAAAANFCAAAIGTETDGSIVSPASCSSLVGLKPTVGLVSRSGIVPISHVQDTAGPMCRTVRDAAIMLSVLAAPDPRDRATIAGRPRTTPDYVAGLDVGGLKGARIGIARAHYFGYHAGLDKAVEDALDVMRRLGATIVDPADLTTTGQYDDAEAEAMLYEFKADLNRYLSDLGPSARVHTLADVIAFNDAHRDAEMPYFRQEIMVRAQAKGPLTTPAYLAARAKCSRLSRALGIDRTMDSHRLDAIVLPTGAPPTPIDLVNGDGSIAGAAGSSTPAAVAGYPHITVPVGFVLGLPIGISFIGRAYTEGQLLKYAYAYEQAATQRQPPGFKPTVDLGHTGRPRS